LSDFVFLIDASGSMGDNISAVSTGLSGFVNGLNAAEVDGRFSIILFGGAPELVLDFTSSGAAVQTAFGKISANGAVAGFQNNHNVNPEAGLEAVRIALGGATDNTLLRTHVGGSGGLSFRAGARQNLILVTDEDSDLPYYTGNRFTGQSGMDPPSPLTAPWQAEVDDAAATVVGNQAFLNMLVDVDDAPSAKQYGNPGSSVQDANFLNFDPDATLANLIAGGFGNSLEAQVLSAGLIARTFDISQVNNANFVNNFFAAKIEETVDNPLVPEPGTLSLLGVGLAGLVARRRRRR
jgi:hypothetical protein